MTSTMQSLNGFMKPFEDLAFGVLHAKPSLRDWDATKEKLCNAFSEVMHGYILLKDEQLALLRTRSIQLELEEKKGAGDSEEALEKSALDMALAEIGREAAEEEKKPA